MESLTKKLQAQFNLMCVTGKLFESSITGRQVWNLYMKGFGTDIKFRDPESSSHNCNHCKNFIRRYGNVVAINSEGNIISMFNVETTEEYQNSMNLINEALINAPIKDVFFETYNELNSLPYESCNKNQDIFKLGIPKNVKRYTKEEAELYGVVKPNEIRTFNHFHLDIPKQFVDNSGKSVEAIMAFYRDKYSVFKRTMEEIPLDTLILVKDLINQGSLLDGTAHLHSIEVFIQLYKLLPKNVNDNWYWSTSYILQEREAKFKNTLIGVLCTELAEGLELNKACENWNKRVDPVNYHKATAPITQKQIKEAQLFVEENDYTASFNRRLANINDIRVSEILHSNVGDGKLKSVSIFDNIKPSGPGKHKRAKFDKLEEISIEKFMKDILPSCTSIEAYLENRMEGNLCVLTKAEDNSSKPIFKWNNNYSWTFNGNLAGKSQIKEAVKSRGGNIDADIRISLAFPGTTDDYDLYVNEPGGNVIYYSNKRRLHASSGMLDLDAQGGDGHFPPERRVENTTYKNISSMPNGRYDVYVNNHPSKVLHTDCTLEIEILGEISVLEYKGSNKLRKPLLCSIQKNNNEVNLIPSKNVTILESKSISKEIWNLETNNFHKVKLACLSPNHWGDNKVGNLHYMFMLDNCKAEGSIRSFHNENLIPELITQHRKVMEVLGSTNMLTAEDYPDHLAGLGFNSTVKDEMIVRCKGSFNRDLKVTF